MIMAFILAKKVGMSQHFAKDGTVTPVTLLEAGPMTVTQVKTEESDGYNAVQVGFEEKRHKLVKKPQIGHTKGIAGKTGHYRWLREFIVADPTKFEKGKTITVDTFKEGEDVTVAGTGKGRGFAGVIKRHNFSRGPKTHGSRHHREPGSIGAAFPQHVPRGTKLPGQYGAGRVTTKNLSVVVVDPEQNLLAIKGAVPGPRNGLITIITNVGGDASVAGDAKADDKKLENKPENKKDTK